MFTQVVEAPLATTAASLDMMQHVFCFAILLSKPSQAQSEWTGNVPFKLHLIVYFNLV